MRTRHVYRVDNAAAKRQKCREHVARYRREEQIQGNRPPGPPRDIWPGLDHGPPEKKSSSEKGQLLPLMPPSGLHATIQRPGHMPDDHTDGAGKPARNRIGENASTASDRCTPPKRT